MILGAAESLQDPELTANGNPSVVMPTLNEIGTIDVQLEALSRQTYKGAWELVVADNGSTDGTVERVQSWTDRLPQLRVCDASHVCGDVSAARVAGVAAASHDLLAFCDGDDRVHPDWLEHLIGALGDNDLVGGFLCEEELNEPFLFWEQPWPRDSLPLHLGCAPFASGANFAVRRNVVDAVGGWDSALSGAEDVDFSIRARHAGFKIGHVPKAIVSYRHRSSSAGIVRQNFLYGRAGRRLYKKHRDFLAAHRVLVGRAARLGARTLRSGLWSPLSKRRRVLFLRSISRIAGWFGA